MDLVNFASNFPANDEKLCNSLYLTRRLMGHIFKSEQTVKVKISRAEAHDVENLLGKKYR